MTYIIQNYINSITNVWSPVNNSGTSIYYNNIGSVGIGTDNPNLNRYKLDVNGNINCTNININNTITTSIINATSLNGDGNNITNLNYLNILNKPNLSNVNNIIFDTFKNNFYSSNFNSTFSIGYNNYDNIYKLSVNGSIISENNINARNNIQETGINLIDKYLTIQNASSTYLNINGGSINNFLNIGINGYNDPNYKLIVNGNINCFSNINSLNYFINNINLKDIFLSSLDARNNYLSIISGGTINSNVIINANLSIGTNINNLYKLNVNGNINSFSNIYANNFIENSSNLRDKYLSIIDASNIYFRNIGGNINGNININGLINVSNVYSNNILIDFNSYLTNNNFNNFITSYPTLNYLNTNFITSNDLTNNYFNNYSKTGNDPNYLKINSSGSVLGNLNVNGILNTTSNINIGFTTSSIPLNPNNYLLNINGSINSSNIYSNNTLIDFNSYLTKNNFNNFITSYSTLNYLNTNFISSNDLTNNYFTKYSITGNDPNYLKINSGGSVLNTSILNISNLTTSNLTTSNLIGLNITTSNLTTSNLIGLNISTSNLIGLNISTSNLTTSNLTSFDLNSSNLTTSNINCKFDILSTNFIENGSNLKNKYLSIFDASNTYFNFNSNNFILGNNILNYNLNIKGTLNCYSNIIENGSNLKDKYLIINNLTSTINSNIYDFVNIQKKFGFRVICTVPVILNNITYYKYDINISKYIKDRTDSTNLNPYRIFNIKCFTVDTIFDTGIINKAPNILQYDIYMSLLQPNDNINITAIGFPTNYYLTKITAGDIFILKTSNYNYISIVSRNINTKITCIISDILF